MPEFFASGRSAHGVSVLANEFAAMLFYKGDGCLPFGVFVVPATGEDNIHNYIFAYGLGAEVERGEAGDNFGIGESADIAHLGGGDFACFEQGVKLQTGGDTGKVTAFIYGSKSVVIVGKVLGVGLGSGSVAELYIGELFGGLDHIIFVAEAVGEDDIATLVYKVGGCYVASVAFGDVSLHDNLGILKTKFGLNFIHRVDEVLVISGLLIVQ